MNHLSLKLRSEIGIVLPSTIFTSITRRTCQSAIEVWRPICGKVPIIASQVSSPPPPSLSLSPLIADIKELRDTLCGLGFSRRGPLSQIKRIFPGITIPANTTENDDLWLRTGGLETPEQLNKRVKAAFENIWEMSGDDGCASILPNIGSYRLTDWQVSLLSPIRISSTLSTIYWERRNRNSKLLK